MRRNPLLRDLDGIEILNLTEALGDMRLKTAIQLDWPWMTTKYHLSNAGKMEGWARKYPCISFYNVTSKPSPHPLMPSRMFIPNAEEMLKRVIPHGEVHVSGKGIRFVGDKTFCVEGLSVREGMARLCILLREAGIIVWPDDEWEKLEEAQKKREADEKEAMWK